MPCYHPLHGYRSKHLNPETGKRGWVSKLSKAINAERLSIPCSRCIGCKLEYSRQWAIRCMHEKQMHADNSFVTLTYAPENAPYGGTLIKKDFQDFAKRLRKAHAGRTIKYFHCGEYGERNKRPHYHALLFGVDFPDKEFFKTTPSGERLYTSETLQRLWPAGFCTAGDVTFESAAYVARYVVKKITGEQARTPVQARPTGLLLRPYERLTNDGEIVEVIPEYVTMSLKSHQPGQPGGIAASWYGKFKGDVYPHDEVILRGRAMKPPKFYDRLLEMEDPEARAVLTARRLVESAKREADQTTRRLQDREAVKLAQITNLKRGLE